MTHVELKILNIGRIERKSVSVRRGEHEKGWESLTLVSARSKLRFSAFVYIFLARG